MREVTHAFEELPLFGGPADGEVYAAYVAGEATIMTSGDDWWITHIDVDTHRKNAVSRPVLRSLPRDHALFVAIKAALEGPCVADVEASIQSATCGWEMVA